MEYCVSPLYGTNQGAALHNLIMGGLPFSMGDGAKMCSKIQFWAANGSTPSSVEIFWTDGSSVVFGPGNRGTTVTLSLSPGERIKSWQVFPRTDGGAGMGAWVIRTNMMQRVQIGNQTGGQAYAQQDVGSGLLVGLDIYWASNSLDVLGIAPIFLKPITSISLTGLDFGIALTDTGLYTSPVTVADTVVTNKTSIDQNWNFSDSISKEISHEYSNSTALLVGGSVTVSAGFLDFKASATAEWSFTNTQTTTDTITDTTTVSWSVSGTVKPGGTVAASAAVWKGVLDLPYTGTVTLTMAPSTGLGPLVWIEHGVYKSVQYSSAQLTVTEVAPPPANGSSANLTIRDHIKPSSAPPKVSKLKLEEAPKAPESDQTFSAKGFAPADNDLGLKSATKEPDLFTNNGKGIRHDELAAQVKALSLAIDSYSRSQPQKAF